MNNNQTAKAEKCDLREIVTESIIAQLEKGSVPWINPGQKPVFPRNLISPGTYCGINVRLLALPGYAKNYFLTWKQLNAMGGSVKQGEKSYIMDWWNYIEKEKEDGW